MVKAAKGGGGRGMRLVDNESELHAAIKSARSEAQSAFGSGELIIEKAINQRYQVIKDPVTGEVPSNELLRVYDYIRDLKAQGKVKHFGVSNFTPIPRDNFRIGVDDACELSLALNTDDVAFWGSGYSTLSKVKSSPVAWNDRKHSIEINLPPLSTVFYVTCDA